MSSRPFDVVILSSVDWDAAWQRHHAFATLWARAGHRVFFVENTGFRGLGLRDAGRIVSRLKRVLRGGRAPRASVPKGVSVVSPFVLPPTRTLFREANASLLAPRLADILHARGLRRGAVVFAYLPTATTLALLDQLAPSLVVYDCVDNFYGLPSPPPNLAETEAALMARAGIVLTTSSTLHDDKKGQHPRVIELHHGVGPNFFLKPRPPGPVRRLCYFGTIWRAVNYEPLKALAEAGFSVDLIGPVKEQPPVLPPSVRLLGRVAHDALPGLLAGYDALLLPYVDDEYNRGVIPAKTYECLATGLPVLASPLPALAGLSGPLTICRSTEDWVAAARAAGEEPPSAARTRIATARYHAEDAVFARLSALVDDARRATAPSITVPPRMPAFLSGLGWIGFLYGLAKASTLLTQIAAGRWLGPEEYGRANLVLAASSYLQIAPMLGFPTAMGKFLSEQKDETRRARFVSTALASFAVWTLLCLPAMAAAHHALSRFLSLPEALFLPSLILATANATYVVVASPLLGLHRFAHRGLVEAVYGLSAPLALLAAFLLFGADHRALISALSTGFILGSLYALWCQRRYIVPAFEPTIIKAVWRYAVVASLNLLAVACVLAPARFILHVCRGAEEVGLFSAYFTATVQVALAFLYMLQSVIVPIASDERGQRETWALVRRWAAPVLTGGLVLFLAGLAAALAVFGRRYPMRWDWMLAFSVSAVLVLAHGTLSALYSARDFSGLRISVFGGLLAGAGNAVLAAWLIPIYGVTGAAAAVGLSFTVGLAFFLGVRAFEQARDTPVNVVN